MDTDTLDLCRGIKKMKTIEPEVLQFNFLKQAAMNLGATDAKVITSSDVIVENRVPLKCRTGCTTFGTRLTCPPHAPTPDEFRTILSEYQYAMLVKFTSPAVADPEIICSLTQYMLDKKGDHDKRERATAFMAQYMEGNTERLNTMLELERQAFNAGYTFALAFVNGSCRLCETCNTKGGTCLYPTKARYPEHAVGINMIKTAERAGISISFPVIGHPSPMALLLID